MESDDEAESLEAVFIAGNLEEVRRIEQLLATEGIEYSVRPQTFRRSSVMSPGPFDGLLFAVLPGQAPYCRKLFTANGLQHGVVSAEPEDRLEFPVE